MTTQIDWAESQSPRQKNLGSSLQKKLGIPEPTTRTILITDSIENMLTPGKSSILHLGPGTYSSKHLDEVKTSLNTLRSPSIILTRGTSITLNYNDGTSRTVNNPTTKDDAVVINTFGVMNFTTKKISEHFKVSRNGMSFTNTDILIVIFIIFLIMYFYNK